MRTRRRRRSPRQRHRRRPGPPRILVLECDPAILHNQGVEVARQLRQWLERVAEVRRVAGDSRDHLLEQFARCASEHYEPDVLVIVGHSSPSGLRLLPRPEKSAGWRAVANWVAPLNPKKVVVVGCEAGRLGAVRTLFNGVPSLDEVVASPVVIFTQQHIGAIVVALAQLLGLDDDLSRLLSLGNFLVTRCVMLRWKRAEFDAGNEEAAAWQVGDCLLELIRRVSGRPVLITPPTRN